jgi:signal transduction histidine kinase
VIHGVLADIDILKRAEAERHHLLRRLASAQEEEQRRISRELHDQIGQTVTGLSLGLKALEQGLAKGRHGEVATEQVRWLERLAAEIGRDIHRTASDLRPTAIDDLGIFKAIEAYVADWQERYGVRVDFQTLGRDESLPADVSAVLYRLVQEGLTNVLKHASASKVSIVLEKKREGLALVIEDDGAGFDPEIVGRPAPGGGRKPGLGLSGMKERVALLGGTIAIESSPGKGSTIFVQIPLGASEAAA